MIYYLPYPISTNRYWRNYRGKTVRSKEANEYKSMVLVDSGLKSAKASLTLKPVSVTVILQPKLTAKGVASKIVMDLDNCLKVALDALQGIAYDNDKQIRRISAEYGVPREGGGLVVQVQEMLQ